MNYCTEPLDLALRGQLIAQLRPFELVCRYCGEELTEGEAVPENGEMCTQCGGNKSPQPMERQP